MTGRPALGRVLTALAGRAPEAWTAAVDALATERTTIDAALGEGSLRPVYGFTTLLGHLDAGERGERDERQLLEAHLVGPQHALDPLALQLVAACKAEQAHHGGSGIGVDAFTAIVEAARTGGTPAQGAWTTSYGSGDVVPASWWVQSLRARGLLEVTRPGDTITLINGSFFGAAAAITAGAALIVPAAEVLSRLETWPQEHVHSSGQRPISLRDPRPVADAVQFAVREVADAVEHRLAHGSANPRFEFDADGTVEARSQSSFLDFRLTFALTTLVQTTALLIAATQRVIEAESVERLRTADVPEAVQPPKAAQALVEAALLEAGGLPSRFSGAESDGIEDLRDLSLLTAVTARRMSGRLCEMIALLERFSGGRSSGAAEAGNRRRIELMAAFTGGDEHADVVARLAALRFDGLPEGR